MWNRGLTIAVTTEAPQVCFCSGLDASTKTVFPLARAWIPRLFSSNASFSAFLASCSYMMSVGWILFSVLGSASTSVFPSSLSRTALSLVFSSACAWRVRPATIVKPPRWYASIWGEITDNGLAHAGSLPSPVGTQPGSREPLCYASWRMRFVLLPTNLPKAEVTDSRLALSLKKRRYLCLNPRVSKKA